MITKEQIRIILRKKRKELGSKDRISSSLAIADNLFSYMKFSDYDFVGCYDPIDGEVNTYPIMDRLIKSGKKIIIPETVIDIGLLEFYSVEDGVFYTPGLILVPLVGFDIQLNRLGFGRGWYDRTINRLRKKHKLFTIGLAYSCQLATFIPVDDHDEKLDLVVTEERVYEL